MNAQQGSLDRRDLLTELSENTLTLVLIFISASVWIWLWFSSTYLPPMPPEATLLSFSVVVICALAYWLKKIHFRSARYFLVVGLWLCNAWASLQFDLPVFFYLFSLITMLGCSLLSPLPAVLITSISSAFMLVQLKGASYWTTWTILPALLSTWLTLAVSFSVFSRLYQALNIAWRYEDYAVQQMREAREHRAELMRISKALKEAQQSLEHANIQLSHARDAAEEARRLKVLFAANVSHELRTPINLVVGFSEMIIAAPQSYGVPLPSAYWTDINIVYRNARHLQSLINDVLDISQIEAGQMALMKEEVNPAVVILEAADLVRESITRRGLIFEICVSEALPPLWLDRLRIRQVILNLLSNAMRFTDEGKITLQARLEANFLHIDIWDTGVGIQAEDLDSIFEEFHQLENSLSKQYGGSGLGLTLSKQFVEMHGGQIRAESEGMPGKGSKFTVSLPVSSGSNNWKFRGQRRHTQEKDNAQSIIVLDDDPAILQLFERYTEKHHAIGVQESEEALFLAETIHPAALIVDNKRSYTSLVDTMHALGIRTPIISCSMPSGRRILRSLGIADYLIKPVTSEALLHTLDGLHAPIQRVLIIDDEPDIVRMFSRMLQNASQPYQIWKAYNGHEGLMLMQEQVPDVVILDVLMPEVDGFGVVEHMKAHPALANIPILLTSARGTFDAITPSTDGIVSVHKPAGFQPIELIRCVESIINTLTPTTEPMR